VRNDDAAVDDSEDGLPRVRREPPIQIAPDFKTVDDCKSVITALDFGQFMLAAWLVEQMLWNSRVRGVNNTRFAGLIGTPIRWEPGRNNELGRRAARDIVEDWPLIASPATRKQLARWGVNLGTGFAQKHWYTARTSGRRIPRLETYHPQWAIFDWSLRAYRVWTMNGWAIVPSPALQVPGETWEPTYAPAYAQPDTLKRWVVHEPFGQHSWREGMIHAAWRPWLGHEWANRDMGRGSEKMGLGIVKLKYPKATDKTALNYLISKMRRLGAEGVLPVEQYSAQDGMANYDVEPFEWTGTGFDIIRGTKESNATDLAVLYLGHNTTAETKGASVGASAQVGNLIRGDIRVEDCYSEFATMVGQVLPDWAEENYGDPGVAPIPIYETDNPSENVTASQTLFNVANAIEKLRANCPGVDFAQLLSRFRVPMSPGIPVVGAVQTPAKETAAASDSAADEPSGDTATVSSGAPAGNDTAAATIALTPSDLASIVRVDEGRRSIGLTPIGGDIGGKWIREHGAELAASLPPEPTDAPPPGQQEPPQENAE
jgi:hypothetical protein